VVIRIYGELLRLASGRRWCRTRCEVRNTRNRGAAGRGVGLVRATAHSADEHAIEPKGQYERAWPPHAG